jgi:hypothetical protein
VASTPGKREVVMQQWYKCPKCGAQVAFGTRFCGNCQTQLNWPTQPQPQYQPPPQQPAQYQQQYQQQVKMASPSVSSGLAEADKLLKEATTKKKSGDINGAIKALRDSYKMINENPMSYPIQTYLRLPLYLQEAGKGDEAWSEFNQLIMWVNTKQRYSPEVTPMELSIIWDKMRLHLQREGKNDYAVQFAVWSYLSWAVGLYMQKRKDELKAYKAETNIQKALKTSLHKAGKEFLTDRLIKIILNSLNNLPVVDYKEVAKTVQEEMKLNSK